MNRMDEINKDENETISNKLETLKDLQNALDTVSNDKSYGFIVFSEDLDKNFGMYERVKNAFEGQYLLHLFRCDLTKGKDVSKKYSFTSGNAIIIIDSKGEQKALITNFSEFNIKNKVKQYTKLARKNNN